MKSKLLSRKFLMALATGLLIAFNDALGWGLSQETIITVSGVVVGYIASEAATDVVKAKKANEASTVPSEVEKSYHGV